MAVISASDLDPVADDGLNHKSVLEVTNAVALLCLAPVDTWKKKKKTDLEKWRLAVFIIVPLSCLQASIFNQHSGDHGKIASIYVLRGSLMHHF